MSKNVTSFRGESFYTPNVKMLVKDEPVTPDDDFGNHHYSFEDDSPGLKKSLSMSDINALRQDLMKFETQSNKNEVYQRYRRPTTGSTNDLQQAKSKFVSMAEAVYHFQRDTPCRFHTRPSTFCPQEYPVLTGRTIPQSPMLRCKQRSRPVHVMTQQEKEELELEEIRKIKIKANPIPKSVIEGPHLPEVPRKPPTIPEPFKLTQIPKRAITPDPKPQFKAKPAPKHILEKPKIPPVLKTAPCSSNINCKRSKSYDKELMFNAYAKLKPLKANGIASELKPVQRQGPIRAEPFSFAQRDEEIKRHRDDKIKKQIEEERKQANQFKAQPLPGVVKKVMQTFGSKSSSTISSENKENHFKFEARKPVVLYKEPFKPILNPTLTVKSHPFELTTEKRAAERERFDMHLKEQEEEQLKIKEQRQREQKQLEEKRTAELRAKLVHHPKPFFTPVPFIPEKSEKPMTVPATPKFVRRLKQN